MTHFLSLIIPLFNFFFIFSFYYNLNYQIISSKFAVRAMFTSVVCSINTFYKVCILGNTKYLCFGSWVDCHIFQIKWDFIFDQLSVFMVLIVNFISFLVHIYSLGYMKFDKFLETFILYLSLFTFFMLLLITAGNFIILFFGWEGVGLCSYLLINFWHNRNSANKAALKALLVNRLGDFYLLSAIQMLYYVFGSFDFLIIFTLIPFYQDINFFLLGFSINFLNTLCFFLFLGSIAKSAQLGLHMWLPDAMEGPTPVSALIHAATMVTAGVFLIIRCSPIFEYSPKILIFIIFLGSLTAMISALIGLMQNDIKKIIAYSTCSQLGYMMFSCGLSGYYCSMYHLINHAFFKALLFLTAGIIIHSLQNEQDIRRMGGLIKFLPLSYCLFLIGSLSLSGFPFFSGFYSKDSILELSYNNYSITGVFSYWVGSVTAGLTAFYSFRLIYFVFFSSFNFSKRLFYLISEEETLLIFPVIILSFFSLFSGFLLKDIFIGPGSDFFKTSIFIHPTNRTTFEFEFISFYFKNIPTIFFFGGFFLSIFLNNISNRGMTGLIFFKLIFINNFFFNFFFFFSNKINIDLILNFLIVKFFKLLLIVYMFVDKGLLEIWGSYGLWLFIKKISLIFTHSADGFITSYSALFIFFTYFLIIFSIFS